MDDFKKESEKQQVIKQYKQRIKHIKTKQEHLEIMEKAKESSKISKEMEKKQKKMRISCVIILVLWQIYELLRFIDYKNRTLLTELMDDQYFRKHIEC